MDTMAVEFVDVHHTYPGEVHAVASISLSIESGQWVCLMGPSGSGKTTLLNLISGLDGPSAGRARVLGRDLSGLNRDELATFRRENIGLVFQQFHLIPHLTALENIMIAQYYHSMIDKPQALRALEAVQLADRAGHLPSQLSGGEQQRVCIARALINEPRLVLADEPTANLDETNERKVIESFCALHGLGTTLIVATHDKTLEHLAQRRIDLKHGRLVRDSTRERRCNPGAPLSTPRDVATAPRDLPRSRYSGNASHR